MTAEKRGQKKPSWIVVTALAGGAVTFLVLRLTSPSLPPAAPSEEYTFQPEPRRTPINLQESSGGLSNRSGAASPARENANCDTLQQFANFEYEKRHRDGKVSELMIFRGFERQEISASDKGLLSCSGGSFERRGKGGTSLTCNNVILSYNSRTNTLTYNIQYVYLARGLQPQCSNEP